ncbi:NAD-binding protein, partial [Sulfitobacter sp. M23508]
VEIGITDAASIAPLAFALVAATVVLHGFTLTPLARLLALTASANPGVIILGGSRWSVALAEALKKMDLQVIIADPNHAHLRGARDAGVQTFFGDLLSKAAEERLDLVAYDKLICATDNDAYNTLVATDLAPEFGRENVYQLKRVREASSRHALPATLGGQAIGGGKTYSEANALISDGWEFRVTSLSEEFTLDMWRDKNPDAIPVAELEKGGEPRFLGPDLGPKNTSGVELLSLTPPKPMQRES